MIRTAATIPKDKDMAAVMRIITGYWSCGPAAVKRERHGHTAADRFQPPRVSVFEGELQLPVHTFKTED
jgi:hypothetical protein